jgi:hypothetical protein
VNPDYCQYQKGLRLERFSASRLSYGGVWKALSFTREDSIYYIKLKAWESVTWKYKLMYPGYEI